MNDTNYIGGIVKILEVPKQNMFNNDEMFSTLRAQLPQARQRRIVHLKFFGKLAKEIEDYYKVQDYILIEGYLSFRDVPLLTTHFSSSKKVEITVLKVHPFLLHSDLQTNQI